MSCILFGYFVLFTVILSSQIEYSTLIAGVPLTKAAASALSEIISLYNAASNSIFKKPFPKQNGFFIFVKNATKRFKTIKRQL